MLSPNFTGRKRHRIQKLGFFNPKYVLVLQYEVREFVPEFIGGRVEGEFKNWWIDAKPEWELTENET